MSGVVSDLSVAPAAEPAHASDTGASAAFIESTSDDAETRMAYDPNGHVPIVVVSVWVCAMLGLATYSVIYYLPDIARWWH